MDNYSFLIDKIITFGNYGGKALEWTIKEVNKKTVMDNIDISTGHGQSLMTATTKEQSILTLVCNECITARPYGQVVKSFPLSFANSELANWLNHEFLDTAFKDYEKNQIARDDDCNCVSLLSLKEFKKFFKYPSQALCKASQQAIIDGALVDKNTMSFNCWYWLKDMSAIDGNVLSITYRGLTCIGGCSFESSGIGVRPVICIKI